MAKTKKSDITKLGALDEKEFQKWYKNASKKLGLNSDPDAPEHYYDYRGHWLKTGGAPVTGKDYHFDSQFKTAGHPNLYVNEGEGFFNTKTGDKPRKVELGPREAAGDDYWMTRDYSPSEKKYIAAGPDFRKKVKELSDNSIGKKQKRLLKAAEILNAKNDGTPLDSPETIMNNQIINDIFKSGQQNLMEDADVLQLGEDRKVGLMGEMSDYDNLTSGAEDQISPISIGDETSVDEMLKNEVLDETDRIGEKSAGVELTTGDKIGMMSTALGSLTSSIATIVNRAGDSENRSHFDEYATDSLNKIQEMKALDDQITSDQERDLILAENTQRAGNRNVRGFNTMKALDLGTHMTTSINRRKIRSDSAKRRMGILEKESDVMLGRDRMKMGAEERADIANREDRDAFFTNMVANIGDMKTSGQKLGSDLNTNYLNNVKLNLLNNYSKYGWQVDQTGAIE